MGYHGWSVQVGRLIAVSEFWVFVTLRETHVINWSWWWLGVFYSSEALSVVLHAFKAERE